MKRILFLFLGLSLLASCSSDDNAVVENGKLGELVVKIEQKEYYVGDEVSIKVESQNGEEIKDATIFIDEKQVNALYELATVGDFKVVAKKVGYTSSKAIDMTVKPRERVMLSVKESRVALGDKIVFEVVNGAKKAVPATIYHVERGETIEGTEYVPTEVGTHTFFTKNGNGYKESNIVTVEVIANTNNFKIGDKKYEIQEMTFDIVQYTYGSVVRDRVYILDGKAMNAVEINAWNINGEAINNLNITIWIPNPTIKINSKNEITDFGQRVSLSNSNEWVVREVFVMRADEESKLYTVRDKELTNVKLSTKKLMIPNNGIGAGKYGVVSHGEFNFSAFGDEEMKLLFNGAFVTTEFVSKF